MITNICGYIATSSTISNIYNKAAQKIQILKCLARDKYINEMPVMSGIPIIKPNNTYNVINKLKTMKWLFQLCILPIMHELMILHIFLSLHLYLASGEAERGFEAGIEIE